MTPLIVLWLIVKAAHSLRSSKDKLPNSTIGARNMRDVLGVNVIELLKDVPHIHGDVRMAIRLLGNSGQVFERGFVHDGNGQVSVTTMAG